MLPACCAAAAAAYAMSGGIANVATELQSLLLILLSPLSRVLASYAEAGFAGPLFANISASICRVAAFAPGARFSRHAS